MRAVITILDNITETSMPFNEFVLYRARTYKNEKQIAIICRDEPKEYKAYDNVKIIYAGRGILAILLKLKKEIAALKQENIPFVIHVHQVQSGVLSLPAIFILGLRKKVIFTVHSTFSGYKIHNKILSLINAFFAERISCVSNVSYEDYPSIIKLLKGDRIIPIQNGVDTDRIDGLNFKHRDNNKIVFIYVARQVPVKNHKFLVKVINKCPKNIQFIFVGAEDKEKSIRRLAESIGCIQKIKFTGLVSREKVFNELMNADYYISPSKLEGLPISVLEAMYCGLPCLLSDIPQHRECAGNVATCMPFNEKIWVDEIVRMASLKSEDKALLIKKTRDYVVENFTLSRMHRKYDEIYDSV